MKQSTDTVRLSALTALACVGVLLMSAYALVINSITFATNDYKSVVIQAVVVGVLALILSSVIWRRVTLAARVMLTVCVLANLWTLFDAGGRRLAAVMGW